MKTGFTTTILHSDLESPIEHFPVYKPMHVAAAYGYPTRHDLARVFKGEMPGYSYGRQGNPTATALESKVTLHQQRQTELIMRRADVLHDPPYTPDRFSTICTAVAPDAVFTLRTNGDTSRDYRHSLVPLINHPHTADLEFYSKRPIHL